MYGAKVQKVLFVIYVAILVGALLYGAGIAPDVSALGL